MVTHAMTRALSRGLLLVSAGLLLGGGCGTEPTPDLLSIELFASPEAADPFQDVGAVVVRVKGDDLSGDLLSSADFVSGAPGEASLPKIPY